MTPVHPIRCSSCHRISHEPKGARVSMACLVPQCAQAGGVRVRVEMKGQA